MRVFGWGAWERHNLGTAACKAGEDSLKCPPKGWVEINGTAERPFKGQAELDMEVCIWKQTFSTGLAITIVFQ